MTYLLDTNTCIGYLNGTAEGVLRQLMIASIALARRITLVTHNTREFSRVPGLPIVDWEADSS